MSNNGKEGARRDKLSGDLVKALLHHFHQLTQEKLATYTVERSKSSYHKAKAELLIFDGSGTAVIAGREFGGGQMSLWIK